jgi:3-hydroxybutyryl-CoA dehydrogenase
LAQVSTIAVIGAGVAGREIAYLSALAGYRTVLEDLLPGALRKAKDEIREKLNHAADIQHAFREEVKAAMQRVQYAGSVQEAAREADFVIESVPDEMESKIEIFILLDKICRPHTILASTTSVLSVGEIASSTYRPEKCAGMRFPASGDNAGPLEIVRTAETDDDTLVASVEVARRMKKKVHITQESVDSLRG